MDSSPEINTNPRTTTPGDIWSPVSIIGHGMFPNDTPNSPPTKLPKPSTNASCHKSGLDHIVANFQKLDSPSKDMSNAIDKHPSPVTTNACTIPVDTSTSNLNVAMSCSPLNTPCTDTALSKNASVTGHSRLPGRIISEKKHFCKIVLKSFKKAFKLTNCFLLLFLDLFLDFSNGDNFTWSI